MERISLPFIDLFSFQGEFTKSSPEVLKPSQLRVLENAELFSVYGALRRVRGNKPILQTPYTEGGVVEPTEWLGLHKYPNLNGNLTRQVLFAAGTTMNRINDDGTITEKYSGLTPGIHRTSDQMDQFLFITGQDPLFIGRKDFMLKYDGTNVHNWGVVAPGETETIIYNFDVFPDPVNTVAVQAGWGEVRPNSQYTWDGSGSFEFYDDDPATNGLGIILNITLATPVDIMPVGALGLPEISNRGRVYVFISPEEYAAYVDSEVVVQIKIGSSTTDFYRFDFKYGDFSPGWNIINLDFTLPDHTAGTPDASSISDIQISVVDLITPTVDSPLIRGIYFDRLCILDRGTPSLELEYADRGVGDYSYDTFCGAIISRCNSTTTGGAWEAYAAPTIAWTAADTRVELNDSREGTGSISWDGPRAANTSSLRYTPAPAISTTGMTHAGCWVKLNQTVEFPLPNLTFLNVIVDYTTAATATHPFIAGLFYAGWTYISWPMIAGDSIVSITFEFTWTGFTSPGSAESFAYIDSLTAFYNGFTSNEGNYLLRENPGIIIASGDAVDIAAWNATGTASVETATAAVYKSAPESTTYTRTGLGDAIMTWTSGGIGVVNLTAIGFWLYIDGRDDLPALGDTFLTVDVYTGAFVLEHTYEFSVNDLNSPNNWNWVQFETVTPAYTGPITRIVFTMTYASGAHDSTTMSPQKCYFDTLTAFYNGEEEAISPAGDGIYSAAVHKINPNTATARIDVDLTNAAIAAPIDLIGTAQEYKPAGGNWLLWVYVPKTADLNDPCIIITLGDPALANANVYEISKSQITHSGWNEVQINLAEPVDTLLAGANLNLVARIRVDFITVSPGVVGGPWRVDFWHHNETAAGNLVGDYTYKVTYQTKYGLESNAGPVSATITAPLGGAEVKLTNIPISNDPQVIQRNIYRTVAGGAGEWLQLAYIKDNKTTEYIDKVPDVSLGSTTPPEAGASIFDSSPPPFCGIVKIYNRTVFMAGDPLNPHILYFSKDDDPDAFPVLNAFQLDSRITGIYECYLGLMITTDTDHWRLIGSNPDYTLEKVIEEIGAVGPRAVGTGKLEGWSVDQYGMRLYNLQEMVRISEPIQNQYEHLPNRYDVHTVHSRRHNSILQFNKDAEGKYTNNFMYSYVMDNMRSGGWSRLVIPAGCTLSPEHSAEVEDNEGTIKIYTSSSDGQIYELMADDSANWTSVDGSVESIHFKARTMWMRLGAAGGEMWEATGRVTPRYFELRAMEMDGQDSTWNVTIETSFISQDNPNIGVVDRATLQMYVPAGAGLVRLPIRQKNAGDYVRITIENTDLDRDVVLLGARLYFWVQPSQSSIEPIPELQYGE